MLTVKNLTFWISLRGQGSLRFISFDLPVQVGSTNDTCTSLTKLYENRKVEEGPAHLVASYDMQGDAVELLTRVLTVPHSVAYHEMPEDVGYLF
jgi:hypothetical protein